MPVRLLKHKTYTSSDLASNNGNFFSRIFKQFLTNHIVLVRLLMKHKTYLYVFYYKIVYL